MSVWADGWWMLCDELGDELEAVLVDEPLGLSCDVLASIVHRRRVDVLETLRRDPRFEHRGGGRGSRWRVRTTGTPGRIRTGSGREGSGEADLSVTRPVTSGRGR